MKRKKDSTVSLSEKFNKGTYKHRVLFGIPTTGVIRMEWHNAMCSLIYPVNWSNSLTQVPIPLGGPYEYLVADARNIIVHHFLQKDFEWCFLGNTEIETIDGVKKIKDIKIGDRVKTHTNIYRKVTKTFKREYKQRNPLTQIKTNNSYIKCTPEHPFLCLRNDNINWIKANELLESDQLLYPCNTDWDDNIKLDCFANSISSNLDGRTGTKKGIYYSDLNIDMDLARFFGLYLAEGSVENHGIRFTFHNDEIEFISFIKKICRDKFFRNATVYSRWSTSVTLNIKSFGQRFKKLFGSLAKNKKVPKEVFNWSLLNRLSFIKGYLEGDGSKTNSGISFNSASKKLIEDFIRLCTLSGLNCKYYGYIKPCKSKLKNGHYIQNTGSYLGYISKQSIDKLNDLLSSSIVNSDYISIDIKDICQKQMASTLVDQNVYNLEVEKDNSYIVNSVVVHNCLFIDHDTEPPKDALLKFTSYMESYEVPVVAGLYYAKGEPAHPLIFRGRGNGAYCMEGGKAQWMVGDKVWCDGIPMGMTLIHKTIMQAISDESEDYQIIGNLDNQGRTETIKQVFITPRNMGKDPQNARNFIRYSGTEDLPWCDRIINEEIFKKAGWPKIQKKEFPFLVDTSIFCWHRGEDGVAFPTNIDYTKALKKQGYL